MPYKKVIAVGDSFTRGDELDDCSTHGTINKDLTHSLNTWPALLAKKSSVEYDAIAIGGRGNQWMSMVVSSKTHF